MLSSDHLLNNFTYLKELRQLDVQSNNLSGRIPSSIGNLSNLLYLNVKDNAKLNGELEIFGGSLWRPLMWVGDAGRAIEKVLISEKELICNEIFNMGNSENNFQKKEIANIIKDKFLPNLKIISHKEDSDLRSYKVDFSKIENNLDFKLEKSLEQSIQELIYICSHNLIEDYDNIKYRNH